MNNPIACLTALAGATVLASCAPVPEPASAQGDTAEETLAGLDTSNQCFFMRNADRYSEAPDAPNGNERIFVKTRANERFVLETLSNCRDIDFAYEVALDNRFGSNLCTGDTASLLVPSPSGTDSCMVRVIGRIED